VQSIVRLMHPRRRTALFTATMPAEVEALAASLLRDPKRVEIARPGTPVVRIAETVLPLAQGEKRARLAALVGAPEAERVLVFARTKRGADRVAEALARDGFGAAAIHGNKAQNARQRALKDFAEGRVRILVATDIAARGIDVAGITHVIQYDLPDEPEAYVHRMGRTGRNGADGIAIAFCAPEEREKLRAIEKLTRRRLGAEEDRPARPAPARPAGKPQPGRPGPAKAPPRGALPQGEPTGRAAARRRRRRHGPAGAARGGSAAARVTAG
jgi:ATP-dependent RNA helicase RhlE